MSRIFDALQQSAAEECAGGLQWPLPPNHLFQLTERRKAAARASDALEEEPRSPDRTIISNAEAVLIPSAVVESITDRRLETASDRKDVPPRPFRKCQSLPLLVPRQSRIVCITDKESPAAEKFRYLGLRLRQLREKRPLKRVLITSTLAQEGKSMVAANLACALAGENRERVLLLDGDLRRPSLARLFGLETPVGLCEWLRGQATASTSIYYLEAGDCWIMPAGTTPQNPLELMRSSKVAALFEQLMPWFDWIVIDSPPVLPLADTGIWMRYVDGTLLVTRQGSAEKDQLKRVLELIEPSKLLGTILNGSTT